MIGKMQEPWIVMYLFYPWEGGLDSTESSHKVFATQIGLNLAP